MTTDRARLLRWLGWFAAANALLAALIGLWYLRFYGWPGSWLGAGYLLLAWAGHYAVLVAVPILLLGGAWILVAPRRATVIGSTLLLGTAMLTLLALDAWVFGNNRFHLTTLTLQVLEWKVWLYGALALIAALILEGQVARWAWNFVAAKESRGGWIVLGALAVTWISAQAIHIWADARYYTPVTAATDYFPAYDPLTARTMLTENGWLESEVVVVSPPEEKVPDPQPVSGTLNYPTAALACESDGPPLNIVMIVLGALRADMLDPEWMPSLSAFAEGRHRFSSHYSAGTRPNTAIFSLLYGLPPTYYTSFESRRQPSALVSELQNRNYRMGVFSSAAETAALSLGRTAFAGLTQADTVAIQSIGPAWQRDTETVAAWSSWQSGSGGEPGFSFVYLISPAALSAPEGFADTVEAPASADAAASRSAAYRTAVRYTDQLIGQVLEQLDSSGQLENSIVLVTGDKGQVLDAGIAQDDAGGNQYTQANLQVPLVVHWPGRQGGESSVRTAHTDVVPTLMTDLLGCSNPVADYSVGNSLYDEQPWEWLVAGTSSNNAILTSDQVIISFPNGLYEIRDRFGQVLENAEVDQDKLRQVLAENTRYYR